jgi:secreted PhoX family phosphatase
MPDRKTVYQSDDGTNVGLFMYVADQAGALDSGTLYASKWSQTSAAGASDLIAGDIGWIKLGHASDSEIKSLIDGGITFADIFDTASLDGNGACPVGFKAVNVNGAGVECLALKAGMDKAAAFLETRRYAGYMGATTELRKEEGITFDPDHQRLYVSYSEIQYGMEDNAKNGTPKTTYDAGTGNDVKALFNSCGGVYGFEVGFDGAVGSRYVLKSVQGVVAGHMTALADPAGLNPSTIAAYGEDSPFAGSTCDIDGLANPDNISYMPGQNTLLIGEDTGDGHQNDAVWAFNVGDGKLTRIATTPYGSETTSLYYYPQINRFGYIVTVVQHPYGESDQSKVSSDSAERRSYFGYIGPLAPSR